MLHVVPAGILSFPTGFTVERALAFDAADSDYLSRTPSGSGNRRTWTFSAWVKRSAITGGPSSGDGVHLFGADRGSGFGDRISFGNGDTDDRLNVQFNDTGAGRLQTKHFFRDPTAWTHFVVAADTEQGTAANRIKIYINGTLLTADDLETATYPAEDYDTMMNHTAAQHIGSRGGSASQFMDGYMAEVVMIDGTQLDASSFGKFDSNGVWVPISPSGLTFGTNGFYLDFKSSSIGADAAGSNNWTANSMGTNNVVVESCTDDATATEVAIYPALNPLTKHSTVNLTNENLTHTGTDINYDTNTKVNFPLPSTGKFYFEFVSGSSTGISLGVCVGSTASNESGSASNKGFLYSQANGKFYAAPITAGSGDTYGDTWTTNDVIGVAIDMTNGGDLWFAKNNTWQSSATASEIAAGTTTNAAVTNMPTNTTNSRTYDNSGLFVALGDSSASGSGTLRFASSSWSYSAPTGFGELTTANHGTKVGNYCTWNSQTVDHFPSAKAQLSNGNRTAVMDADSAIRGTHYFDVTDSTGYYWETKFTANIGNASHVGISVNGGKEPPLDNTSYRDTGVATYLSDGGSEGTWSGGLGTTGNRASGGTHATYTNGDTIMIAVKGGAIWFGKNGSWIDGANGGASSSTVLSEINSGTTTNAFFHTITGFFTPTIREHNGTNTTSTTTWGQEPFLYTPPTNMKKLMTTNYSAPTVTDPSEFFQNVLYTGNGSSQSITFGGNSDMQPDLVWIKKRNATANHAWYDSVRGANKELSSSTQNGEQDVTSGGETGVTAFNSDGFTVGDRGEINGNTNTIVAWCWKAGGSGSSDDTGGITVTRSTASHQGFSICKGTSGTGTQNFAHGLGAKPEFVILRDLDDNSQHWQVQHKDVNTNMKDITTLGLNRNVDAGSSSNWWGAEPTSTLQYFTTNQVTGTNDFVCYLFRRIPGLIGIGSYLGNGQADADGPFIAIDDGASGFKPAFLILKEYNGSNNGLWFIRDSLREPLNPTKTDLYASATDSEYTDSNSDIDFLANGFKIRASAGGYNQNGANNLYIAFAENPFGGDSVAQARAR